MVEFKLTFPKAMKAEMEEMMKQEKEIFDKSSGSRVMRGFRWIWKKSYGIDVMPQFEYEFVSDTECRLTIITGLEGFIKEKALLKQLKKIENETKGKVKVELV